MPEAIDHKKRAMRAEIRERRQLYTLQQHADAAESIKQQLDALLETHDAQSISCYLSSPTEPGTRPFLNDAIDRGIRALLPLIREDGLLDWIVGDPARGEVAGPLGIPEPVGDVLGPIAVNDVDVLVIPAAAIDRTGMRLGWGRGYYDKTLGSMAQRPPVYAVIYDSELVDHLPRDVHDQPVTGIVTPTQTLVLDPEAS